MHFDVGSGLVVTFGMEFLLVVASVYVFLISGRPRYLLAWILNQISVCMIFAGVVLQFSNPTLGVVFANVSYLFFFVTKFESLRLLTRQKATWQPWIYGVIGVAIAAGILSFAEALPLGYLFRGLIIAVADAGTSVYAIIVVSRSPGGSAARFDPAKSLAFTRPMVVFASALIIAAEAARVVVSVLSEGGARTFVGSSADAAVALVGLVASYVLFSVGFILASFETRMFQMKAEQENLLRENFQFQNEIMAARMNHELNGPVGNIELLASHLNSQFPAGSQHKTSIEKILQSLEKIRSVIQDRNLLLDGFSLRQLNLGQQLEFLGRVIRRLPALSSWDVRVQSGEPSPNCVFPNLITLALLSSETLVDTWVKASRNRTIPAFPGKLLLTVATTEENRKIVLSIKMDAGSEAFGLPSADFRLEKLSRLKELTEIRLEGSILPFEGGKSSGVVLSIPNECQ